MGILNGHATGIIMKEMVRRALMAIRAQRVAHEVKQKLSYGGVMDDLCTTADTAAQEIYVKSLRECFPNVGIIAEENNLKFFVDGSNAYFTLDPLDGTKAFTRRQSHGVGTMIALVVEGEVVAAYIGDVNTLEIYGYRPGSNNVWRISEFDSFQRLSAVVGAPDDPLYPPLAKEYIILRDPISRFNNPALCERFVNSTKNYTIDGGSIGIWMARLWKEEIAAVLLPPSFETPWDSTPIHGINAKLGYVYLRPTPDGTGWQPFVPSLITDIERRDYDVLILHKHRLWELGL